MRLSILAVATSFLLIAQNGGSPVIATTGSIEGTVLSAEGRPAPDIMVYSVPQTGLRQGLKFPVRTDGSGYFRLDEVKVGPAMLFAYNMDNGYLDPTLAFNSGNRPSAIATVTPNGVTNAQVRLGPKCAYLVGSVHNSEDGGAIHSANFKLTRADDPKIWLSTAPVDESGHFRLAVPSATPFEVQVTAEAFRIWQPDVHQAQALRSGLRAGEDFPIEIQLKPASIGKRP